MTKEKFTEDAAKILGSPEAAQSLLESLIATSALTGMDRKAKIQSLIDFADKNFPELLKNKKTALRALLDMAFEEDQIAKGDVAGKPSIRMVKVKVCAKMAAYGGQIYDRGSDIWIGADPIEIPETVFILQKIGNGELIKVE